MKKLLQIGKLGDIDKIGAGLSILTAAGVGAHAIGSIIQKNSRKDLTDESEHEE